MSIREQGGNTLETAVADCLYAVPDFPSRGQLPLFNSTRMTREGNTDTGPMCACAVCVDPFSPQPSSLSLDPQGVEG